MGKDIEGVFSKYLLAIFISSTENSLQLISHLLIYRFGFIAVSFWSSL